MKTDIVYASPEDVVRESMEAWRPPPKLSLSEWADRYFRLSAESSAAAGRWTTLPYQREPMDCMTDPRVERVTWMKSARVGYTKMLNAAAAYHMHHSPAAVLVVQPTVDDARGYSKEEIAPMLRDVPELAEIAFRDEAEDVGPKGSANTILHKVFPGGVLSLVGANSGTGLRRVSRKLVLFDEVDAYPPSAGSEGDPVELGIKRTMTFHDRKIVCGSTPLVRGTSRIESLYLEGDQRRYFVPCPQCGHMAPLVFSRETTREDGETPLTGHVMRWPEGKPEDAFFECGISGCVIEHKDKRWMVERGEWRAGNPSQHTEKIHASFHIWAAYSYAANAAWGDIAREFLAAKDDVEKLKTFVNTVLGQTWKERGEAPDWQLLHARRETYKVVSERVEFLTAGVDVHSDRLSYEVVGWARDKESWSVESGVFPGKADEPAVWKEVDALLLRSWPTEAGGQMQIARLAVDSGYATNTVYCWARGWGMSRVIAVKGADAQKWILGVPSPVDVTVGGRRLSRGYKVWTVGSSVVKAEVYGLLRRKEPGPGYCHFPEYGEDFFRELTAEQMVTVKNRRGFAQQVWVLLPQRQNHFLDCRVYARAAAASLGLDRWAPVTTAEGKVPLAQVTPAVSPPPPRPHPAAGGWLGDRRNGRGGGGWLGGGR